MRAKSKRPGPPPSALPEQQSGAGRRVCVARIGAPHGVRGEVRLRSFTVDPLAVAHYGPLQTADGARTIAIASLRRGKDGLIARLEGVHDRNAAEQLRNVELFVPRQRLPEPGEQEFYHADLIGLAVDDALLNRLGTVIAVHNFGAGDILEIEPTGGGPTAMLAFAEHTVPVVDLAHGRIVANPPDGWLESSPIAEGGEPGAGRAVSQKGRE